MVIGLAQYAGFDSPAGQKRRSGGELLPTAGLVRVFLARETVPRPRDCFEALQLQFLFALHARSEFVVLDSPKRFIDQRQHGPVGIGLAEQNSFV